jgi:hypothetical protein
MPTKDYSVSAARDPRETQVDEAQGFFRLTEPHTRSERFSRDSNQRGYAASKTRRCKLVLQGIANRMQFTHIERLSRDSSCRGGVFALRVFGGYTWCGNALF